MLTKKVRERLHSVKTVKICGNRFRIRKINPLLDFELSDMPQIFTSYVSRRKQEPESSSADPAKVQRQIMNVVKAGLISVNNIPVSDNDGEKDVITIEDVFRDPEVSNRLYVEIILHSLNKFRGLKGVFFSIFQRFTLFMSRQRNTPNALTK
jgi:hypothetical protein